MYNPDALMGKPAKTFTRLIVGVGDDIPGMSMIGDDGQRQGFDIDIARALAAVLHCDAQAVDFVTIAPTERFRALHERRIDVGLYNASCTRRREIDNDVVFPAISLIDGEGILVRRDLNVSSLRMIERPVIAAQKGTTTRSNLERFLSGHAYCVDEFSSLSSALEAYVAKRCDALVFDSIILGALRARMADMDEHVILDARLSREAMGPVVLKSRGRLVETVRWTIQALVLAEEAGLSSVSLPDIDVDADDSPAALLLRSGIALDKGDEFATDRLRAVISSVGNYGEIFDRHIGAASPLKMPRGANAPFNQGGAFLPPPLN